MTTLWTSLVRGIAGAAFAAAAAFTAQAAAQPLQLTPLPIESLARTPAMQQPAIAPDGQHIAALVAVPGQRWPAVAVWNTANMQQPPNLIGFTEMRPIAVRFLGNGHLIITADQPFTYGNFLTFTRQAIISDLDGGDFTNPFRVRGATNDRAREAERFGTSVSIVQEGIPSNEDRFLILQTNDSTGASELVAFDVSTMRAERVARFGDDEGFVLADELTGEVMVRQTLSNEAAGWMVHYDIRNRQTGAWERHEALSYPIRERLTMSLIGFFEADRNKLYIVTNRNSNFARVEVYDIGTRQWEAEPAFEPEGYDVIGGRIGLDDNDQPDGASIYTVAAASVTQVILDPELAAVQAQLRRQFPGRQVTLTGSDRAEGVDHILLTVDGPSYPPVYYMLRDRTQLVQLGQAMPWVNPETLGTGSMVRYTARDGMEIPAFVWLPPGYDRQVHGRIPVVVHPHGGPWARDYLDWDSSGWTQFMVTRGYAVIQPQYRGSDGWGMELWKAGDQQWGLAMSDDNDDAAQYLVNEGIGDPTRMAIFGYSYGGFAAIAASVRPNSPYRCALAGAGVSDLERLGNLWGASRIQRELQGWTVDGMSPLANVDNLNIPILLYHGDRDRQADTVHSVDFYRATRNNGRVPVEYHEIEDMWHTLPWWAEWHRESLGLIEGWFAGPNCFGGATRTAGLDAAATGGAP
jgi:acetyl esterase/lipase